MHTKLLIFGITGDLSRRKLLPALHDIVQSGECAPLSIIGVSRREVDVVQLISEATGSDALVASTRVVSMDLTVLEDYQRLRDDVALTDDEQLVIYLSVPPGAAADIADFLGQAGINTPNVKLLFEKPFGFDVLSAQDFITRTQTHFTDDQIYRIDHFMAKEVAMAVLELRANADSHHHSWSNETVERVEVIATETLGIENRATFYEQTGALRDIVQGHLMQLVSLILMEPVATDALEELPAHRLEALERLQPADPSAAIRAQYDGYQEEVENPGSETETFVSIDLESRDPRWAGIPIRLLTGKQLHEKKTAITIEYRDGSKDIFIEGEVESSIDSLSDAYERVLVEAIKGNKYIFTTSPEIIQSWKILAPLQQAWAMGDQPLLRYEKGARGANVHLKHYI